MTPQSTFSSPYTSRSGVDAMAGSDRIACIPIIIEGHEGDGL